MFFTTVVNHSLSRFGLHEGGNAPFPRQPAPTLVEKAATIFDDPACMPDTLAQPLHDWQNFCLLAGGAAELAGVVCGTGFRQV